MSGREEEDEGAGAGGTATREGGIKRVSRPSVKAREGKKVPDTSQQRSNKYRTNKLAAQVAQREDDLCHPARGGVMSPQQVTAGVSPTAGTSTALPRPVTCPVVEAAGAPAATTNLVLLASGDEMSSEEYVSPVKKIWNGRDACRLILASLEERMVAPLERFGTAPTRVEAQVSSSSNPQRPDDQFFQTLPEVYNDAAFEAVIP
jgi:hypothetical protein